MDLLTTFSNSNTIIN